MKWRDKQEIDNKSFDRSMTLNEVKPISTKDAIEAYKKMMG